MATNYPGSLDTGTEQPSPLASTELDDAGFEHDVVHTNHSGAIIALETKLGTGSSTAVANSVLAGTGAGTSAWTTGTLANDISGNAATATALETARTIDITGDITATAVAFDGTSNIAISAAVNNDSHTHDTQYVKLTGSTMTGELQLNARLDVGDGSGGNHEIRIYKSDNNVSDHIQFFNGTTRVGEIGCEDTTWLRINQETNKDIYTPRMIRADTGFQANNGSTASPSYRFANDTNTGMYRYGADGIGFSSAGGLKVLIDNGGSYGRLFGPGFRTGSAIIRGEASAAVPTYTFYSDENTGMYRAGADIIGFSCGGSLRAEIRADGIHLANGDWFRSYGSTGWYNGTYGGGMYMTDSSWVRTYNNKGVSTGGTYAGVNLSTTTGSGYNYLFRNATYSTFYYYTSTRELKENIINVDAADAGTWIDALQPVTFIEKWLKDEEEPEDHRTWREADVQTGFIAEDVLSNPLTSRFAQVVDDDEGGLRATGWKWECVIATCVAELKASRAREAALEARVAALEAA